LFHLSPLITNKKYYVINGDFMFYADCSNCQEKIEYGARQSANAAKLSKIECKKCREKKKAELFEIESKRICPKCSLIIHYKSPYLARVAEKKSLSCISCSKRSENYSGLKRNCPSCKNEIIYKSSDSATRANKLNDICKSCSLKGRSPSPQCIEAAKVANTGKKLSEDHIEIIKNTNTGLKRSEETKRKISESMSGRSFKKETIDKMSISAKNRPPISESTRKKLANKMVGTTHAHSDEAKEKIAKAHTGRIHSKESKRNMKIAQNKRYYREPDWKIPFTKGELKTWASRAKAKTPFCEECGSKEELHAHHIKPKCIYPELALDENNVKILCKKCHIEFHKINSLYDHQE
jgi:5-methylcytosine-specific restriction endonuclease McrA